MDKTESRLQIVEKEQAEEAKLPYPKSSFFILGNELCERFCYYGLRAVLFLYLTNVLKYDKSGATAINHAFVGLCYAFPVLGACIADSYLGKFKTILYLSLVYAVGCIALAIGSISKYNIPQRELSLAGLALVGLGTGGIKPCVSAFGGDQFRLPEQAKQLMTFFSVFYFMINLGSGVSTLLTPELRSNVYCFDTNSCYPLAFGVPAILMIAATVIFVIGKRWYKSKMPDRNVIWEVTRCISTGIAGKMKCIKTEKGGHWLDYAKTNCSEQLITEAKAFLDICVIIIPLPLFWALFDQQSSTWVDQATQLNGEIGPITILPEHMQAINPFLILVMIPLFEYCIYPLLSKMNLLKTPLQRMGSGMVLASLAFIVSALLQFSIERASIPMPKVNEASLRIYNGLDCPMQINSAWTSNISISKYDSELISKISLKNKSEMNKLNLLNCGNVQLNITEDITLHSEEVKSYFIFRKSEQIILKQLFENNQLVKPESSFNLRIVYDLNVNSTLKLLSSKENRGVELNSADNELEIEKLKPGIYSVQINNNELISQKFLNGGVYTILILQKDGKMFSKIFEILSGNTVHILWQIPQVIIITMGEIMLSITGISFSYSQAPVTMKSVISALWLLTTAFGNVFVVIIALMRLFNTLAWQLLFYAVLITIDFLVFLFLAKYYNYKTFNAE